jgi:hypothetical protein
MKPMVVQLQEDITAGPRSMTELLRLQLTVKEVFLSGAVAEAESNVL